MLIADALKLAVDLAKKYNGEIINGDAMQIYDGLPIITNKITVEEQQGIPHHLLGIVGLDEEPWRVSVFKKKAGQVIKEIRSRGRLPILVGGTHYYTQSLLFKDVLVSGAAECEEESDGAITLEESRRRFPILERPTEEILEQLRAVDPVMADRWHPKDRRKIQRSLEIYLTTGKPASKVYKEQAERKMLRQSIGSTLDNMSEPEHTTLIQSTLIFWVHAEAEVLKSRLDSRVDKMIQMGLLEEVEALNSFLHAKLHDGKTIDRSSGIWVSIGFKEFEPYLTAKGYGTVSDKDLYAILAASVEQTKVATRQYSKRQIRWIRLKLLAALSNANALRSLYLLDGSNLTKWSDSVSKPAIELVSQYLAGEELPAPTDMSPIAHELLTPKQTYELCDQRDLWIRQVCGLCNMTAVAEEQWMKHIKSRSHRRAVKKSQNNNSYRRPPNYDNVSPGEAESP